VGILEKPFSLETLRRKLSNIQGQRKLSGNLPGDVAPKVVPPQPPVAEASASKMLPSAAIRRAES